jgi:hypothetical protein
MKSSGFIIDFQYESFNVDLFKNMLAYGGWFSPCTPASSTTKTGRHDIHVAEILLKVVLSTNKSINQ